MKINEDKFLVWRNKGLNIYKWIGWYIYDNQIGTKIGTAYPVNEFQLFISKAKFWLHAILIVVGYKIETCCDHSNSFYDFSNNLVTLYSISCHYENIHYWGTLNITARSLDKSI